LNFLNELKITIRLLIFFVIFCIVPYILILFVKSKAFLYFIAIFFGVSGAIYTYFLIYSFIAPIKLLIKKFNMAASDKFELIPRISLTDEFAELFKAYNRICNKYEQIYMKYESTKESFETREKKTEREVTEISYLYRLGRLTSNVYNLNELFNIVLKDLNFILSTQWSFIELFNKNKNRVSVEHYACSEQFQELEHEFMEYLIPFQYTGSLFEQIVEHSSPLLSYKFANKKKFHSYPEFANSKLKVNTFLGVPIYSDKEIIGAIVVVNKLENKKFTKKDTEFLKELAEIISLEIKRIKSYTQGFIDNQTGLYIPEYFILRLKEELSLCKRGKSNLAVLSFMLEAIDSAYINLREKTEVLKEAAEIIKLHARTFDIASSIKNPVISLLLPDTRKMGSIICATRIKDILEKHTFKKGMEFNVSCGIATFKEDVEEPEQLIERSLAALDKAIENGGGRLYIFSN